MYAEERRQETRGLLEEKGRVSVADLAERFKVTPETIRRDLDLMSAEGEVTRVHGGAIVSLSTDEMDVPTRSTENVAAKRRIGAAAAKLIPTDRLVTILLDGGTTTAELIPHLQPATSVVVTSSLPNAIAAGRHGLERVDQLPGKVRPLTQAVVGADTVEALGSIHPEFVFLGCNGMTPQGFTTPDVEEAHVKEAMGRAGARRIVLADSSKAGQLQYRTFASLSDVDVLITDTGLSPEQRAWFEDKDIEVVLA